VVDVSSDVEVGVYEVEVACGSCFLAYVEIIRRGPLGRIGIYAEKEDRRVVNTETVRLYRPCEIREPSVVYLGVIFWLDCSSIDTL
jgi:hypothetical protein